VPILHWLLDHRANAIRASRWIVLACALSLIAISRLPHGPVDRVLAIVAIAGIALVFATWLSLVIATVLLPRRLRALDARRRGGS
jgi:uncharacterized membrane protein HdeD (DUF308 family)